MNQEPQKNQTQKHRLIWAAALTFIIGCAVILGNAAAAYQAMSQGGGPAGAEEQGNTEPSKINSVSYINASEDYETVFYTRSFLINADGSLTPIDEDAVDAALKTGFVISFSADYTGEGLTARSIPTFRYGANGRYAELCDFLSDVKIKELTIYYDLVKPGIYTTGEWKEYVYPGLPDNMESMTITEAEWELHVSGVLKARDVSGDDTNTGAAPARRNYESFIRHFMLKKDGTMIPMNGAMPILNEEDSAISGFREFNAEEMTEFTGITTFFNAIYIDGALTEFEPPVLTGSTFDLPNLTVMPDIKSVTLYYDKDSPAIYTEEEWETAGAATPNYTVQIFPEEYWAQQLTSYLNKKTDSEAARSIRATHTADPSEPGAGEDIPAYMPMTSLEIEQNGSGYRGLYPYTEERPADGPSVISTTGDGKVIIHALSNGDSIRLEPADGSDPALYPEDIPPELIPSPPEPDRYLVEFYTSDGQVLLRKAGYLPSPWSGEYEYQHFNNASLFMRDSDPDLALALYDAFRLRSVYEQERGPSPDETQKDAAIEAAVAGITQRYALKRETVDRFNIEAEFYTRYESVDKPVWSVTFYPKTEETYLELGSYRALIDAETGKPEGLYSAADINKHSAVGVKD